MRFTVGEQLVSMDLEEAYGKPFEDELQFISDKKEVHKILFGAELITCGMDTLLPYLSVSE